MNLERQSIYTNKKSLADYLRGNALNYELHHIYDSYLQRQDDGMVIPKMTELYIFNELYYRLTWIANFEVIVDTPTKIDKAYVRKWYREMSNDLKSKDTAEFIGCLIVGVFSVMPQRPNTIAVFSKFLDEILRKSHYAESVKTKVTAFKKSFGALLLDFPLAFEDPYSAKDPRDEELARMQKELEEARMQSEEYKKAIMEIKRQVGSTSIPVDVIAKCILRLPTSEAVWAAFKEINTLLVGTVWTSYAENVLEKIIEKYSDSAKPNINIQNQYGPVNGDVQQQTVSIPANPVKSLPECQTDPKQIIS